MKQYKKYKGYKEFKRRSISYPFKLFIPLTSLYLFQPLHKEGDRFYK